MNACIQREGLHSSIEQIVNQLQSNPLYKTYLSTDLVKIESELKEDLGVELAPEVSFILEEITSVNYYNISSKEAIELLSRYI